MLTSLALLTLLLSPQGPPPPPPPPPMPRPARDVVPDRKGTSGIKGFVYSPDGRPLRRAQIRVSGSELNQARTASTGLDGEYEVPDLPSGRYTVGVTRNGYLPVSFGQRRQGEPGMPIELADKQVMDKVNFTLERAGVVSGRVLDEAGEAVGGAYVWVMQSQFFRGQRRFVPINPTHGQTDDTGQYRISSIPPGDYIVQAAFRETWMSDGKEPQMLAYAPSYFPATATPLDAARVRVGPGQESHAIDITLVPGRAAALSGTVLGSDGTALAGASVSLTQQTAGPGGAMMSFIGSTVSDGQGKWRLANISPGEYQLRATGAVADRGTETAMMTVLVSGTDQEGLTLAADPGALISGRVVTDTGDALPKATLRIATAPLVYDLNARPPATPGKDDGAVGADGTFTLKSPSGDQFLRVGALPRGWSIARIEAAGGEFTDRPLDLRPGQHTADIRIVVSNSLPAVTGKVVDDREQRGEATLLLFPVDKTRWHEAGGSLRSTRPDQAGTFRFDAVRPGEYFLAAVDSIQQWQVNDPEYLASAQERATKLVVAREPVAIDVKVAR